MSTEARTSAEPRTGISLSKSCCKTGFTLVELLVVVAIMGILMGLIAGIGTLAKQKAYESKTKAELQHIAKAVNDYLADNGTCPLDLDAAFYLKLPESVRDGKDSWGMPYIYKRLTVNTFSLYSRGRDRQEGSDGTNGDNIYADR